MRKDDLRHFGYSNHSTRTLIMSRLDLLVLYRSLKAYYISDDRLSSDEENTFKLLTEVCRKLELPPPSKESLMKGKLAEKKLQSIEIDQVRYITSSEVPSLQQSCQTSTSEK